MAKASTILKKAKSYIGTKENPANSNNVKFNTDYYGHSVKGVLILGAAHLYGISLGCVMHPICSSGAKKQHIVRM